MSDIPADGARPHAVPRLEFVIVTGLSGAGKSSAIRAFEDIGYYCMDNLPPELVPKFAELTVGGSARRRVAAVCDVRTENVTESVLAALESLNRMEGVHPCLLFVDAQTDVILRRFSQTRRKHPLGAAGGLEPAVQREREILQVLRDKADILIDTSQLSHREFQEKIVSFFSTDAGPRLSVLLTSFGYKYGLPLSADIVLDVRFLPNPYYEPELSAATGLDPRVRKFVEGSDSARTFLDKTQDWFEFLIPQYVEEGKSHLGIAVGCTGGRHRSVTVAERLREFLDERFRSQGVLGIHILHRDIGK